MHPTYIVCTRIHIICTEMVQMLGLYLMAVSCWMTATGDKRTISMTCINCSPNNYRVGNVDPNFWFGFRNAYEIGMGSFLSRCDRITNSKASYAKYDITIVCNVSSYFWRQYVCNIIICYWTLSVVCVYVCPGRSVHQYNATCCEYRQPHRISFAWFRVIENLWATCTDMERWCWTRNDDRWANGGWVRMSAQYMRVIFYDMPAASVSACTSITRQ